MKRLATFVVICLAVAMSGCFSAVCPNIYSDAGVCAYIQADETQTLKEGEATSKSCLGQLTALMYHNTLAQGKRQSVYCINQNNLENDFKYLKENGYNVISCKKLIECAEDGIPLPDKAVLLTFDDGYLNNVTYALPLLKKYNYSGLFSVVGDYAKLDKYGGMGGGDFIYLGWKDIEEIYGDENVEIGLHSFALHNIRPRLGVAQLAGESDEEYKKLFADDTQRLVDRLAEIGVQTNIYAYPFGKYSSLSESVLKDKGISVTLTCNEGVNHIYGKRSLYLLKRINRDATKGTLEDVLVKYIT